MGQTSKRQTLHTPSSLKPTSVEPTSPERLLGIRYLELLT